MLQSGGIGDIALLVDASLDQVMVCLNPVVPIFHTSIDDWLCLRCLVYAALSFVHGID